MICALGGNDNLASSTHARVCLYNVDKGKTACSPGF